MQRPQRVERSVALFGSIICVTLAAVIWRKVSGSQDTWPFPTLYFVELMAMGIIVAAAYLRSNAARAITAWSAAGAVMAFSILGAWTVGLIFLPAAVAFIAAALITDLRNPGRIAAHAGIFIAAGVIQSALMFAMASMF